MFEIIGLFLYNNWYFGPAQTSHELMCSMETGLKIKKLKMYVWLAGASLLCNIEQAIISLQGMAEF